jgi:3-polyprenyl-4-hydroxybenzoate decarboxylase
VSQAEEEILVNRLGEVGWRGGRLGGGVWGASGGRLGARFAARLLPHDVHEIVLVLALPPDVALALARRVLASLGEPADETRLTDEKHELRAVVGSGALNLNPAVVTLQLLATTSASTTIRVRGVAKEGLIRQRAGREAAERVAARLRAG